MTLPDPLTFELQDGTTITFSSEELLNPDFQIGWDLAMRGLGPLVVPASMIKSKSICKIANNAGFALRRKKGVLRTTRSAAAIHALFAR